MRLLGYGPGEIADRLTILQLKIAQGTTIGKPVLHFQKEQTELYAQFRRRVTGITWLEAFTELGVMNAVIWAHTDAVQGALKEEAVNPRAVDRTRLAWLALQLQVCNNRRAVLITIINCNAGHVEEGAEKQ